MIFLRSQISRLTTLLLLTVAPLVIFYIFSPFDAPGVQYAMIAFIVVSQFIIFKDSSYKTKMKESATRELTKELKRVPSYTLINNRLELYIKYKNITAAIVSIAILMTSIFL